MIVEIIRSGTQEFLKKYKPLHLPRVNELIEIEEELLIVLDIVHSDDRVRVIVRNSEQHLKLLKKQKVGKD